jgi:hypothetical protein
LRDGCEPIGRAGCQDQRIEALHARSAAGDDVQVVVAHSPGQRLGAIIDAITQGIEDIVQCARLACVCAI